jgi:predicted nucleotidyltransferase
MDSPFVRSVIEKAREGLRRRAAQRRVALHERYCAAVKDCDAIIAMLRERFNPSRIYQWGSLLDESRFSEISDIDIAVEGVRDAATLFAMLGEAENMTSFPVDLVDLDKVDPLHARSIREKGRLAYERKDIGA